jgi:hypothetical protein
MHLDTAWKIWLYGLPANETIDTNGTRFQAPIRPFRSIKLDMLPKVAKRDFQLHWRPICAMMEQDFCDDGASTRLESSTRGYCQRHVCHVVFQHCKGIFEDTGELCVSKGEVKPRCLGDFDVVEECAPLFNIEERHRRGQGKLTC